MNNELTVRQQSKGRITELKLLAEDINVRYGEHSDDKLNNLFVATFSAIIGTANPGMPGYRRLTNGITKLANHEA